MFQRRRLTHTRTLSRTHSLEIRAFIADSFFGRLTLQAPQRGLKDAHPRTFHNFLQNKAKSEAFFFSPALACHTSVKTPLYCDGIPSY